MFNSSLFKKRSIGVDISDASIEIVEITGRRSPRIVNLARMEFDAGIVERGRIQNKEKLAQIIKKAFLSAIPKPIITRKIIFCAPDDHVYTRSVSIPDFEKQDAVTRRRLAYQEARRSIPLAEDDLMLTYQLQSAGEVLLVAANRSIMREWQELFRLLSVEIEYFDSEVHAMFRGVYEKPPRAPACVVDIGTRVTRIALFDAAGLAYTHSVPIAGEKITQNIAGALKIKQEAAEDRKIKIGLTNETEKEFFVLIKILAPVLDAMKLALEYYEKKKHVIINDILLIGGTSRLPGLCMYISTNLGKQVRLGDSWMNSRSVDTFEYIEAVGCALSLWDARAPRLILGAPQSSDREISRFTLRGVSLPIMHLSKKTLFILSIGVCIVLLSVTGVLFARRKLSSSQQQQQMPEIYTQSQIVRVQIPIAVSAASYTDDRARGRVIRVETDSAGDDNAVTVRALVDAEKELRSGEKMVPIPLSLTRAGARVSTEWLATMESDIERLARVTIDRMNTSGAPYALDEIKKQNSERTRNPDIQLLTVEIVLRLNSRIPENNVDISPQISIPEEPRVRIMKTPTGWLRVRAGAGTGSAEVAKVYPGEEYPIVTTQSGWIQILLQNGTQGWVSTRYTEKVE